MATNWQDRVPTYANRYKITKSDGSIEYVTLERADEPLVEGTPINAKNMNAIENAILTKMEKGAAVEMPKYVSDVFANFNDFYEQGKTTIYSTVGDLDNAPNSTNEFVVITTSHGDGLAGVQFAMTIQHPVKMYARRYINGEWYAWTEYYSKDSLIFSLSGTTLTITTK